MKNAPYVLITPVRDEEATIGVTLESVIRQSVVPAEWVIVSDGSTDRTDEIIAQYASRVPFIRHLRLQGGLRRNFASVVFAVEAGLAALETRDYEFIGLLDADIRFSEKYYEEMLLRFGGDARLGLAGGIVLDFYDGQRHRIVQSPRDVAGAVQLFRRQCFEGLGGLKALPEGGWDVITCCEVRMQGYTTRTFVEIEVDHLKPRNIGEGNLLRRAWRNGVREYAVGNHPIYEMVKCVLRCTEQPILLGAIVRLAGYAWCCLSRRKRLLSEATIHFVREEQLARLLPLKQPVETRIGEPGIVAK